MPIIPTQVEDPNPGLGLRGSFHEHALQQTCNKRAHWDRRTVFEASMECPNGCAICFNRPKAQSLPENLQKEVSHLAYSCWKRIDLSIGAPCMVRAESTIVRFSSGLPPCLSSERGSRFRKSRLSVQSVEMCQTVRLRERMVCSRTTGLAGGPLNKSLRRGSRSSSSTRSSSSRGNHSCRGHKGATSNTRQFQDWATFSSTRGIIAIGRKA